MNFVDNEEYEKEDEDEKENAEEQQDGNVVPFTGEVKKIPAFAVWEISSKKSLKLKLTVSETMELEKKFRKNLMSLIGDEDNLPPLTTMFQVIHAAAAPWNHGIKLKHVMEMYEKYLQNGGNLLKLYADVYLQIFMVSGFFSTSMAEDISDSMEQAKKMM